MLRVLAIALSLALSSAFVAPVAPVHARSNVVMSSYAEYLASRNGAPAPAAESARAPGSYAEYMAQRQGGATAAVAEPEPESLTGFAAYMAQRQEAPAAATVPVSAPVAVTWDSIAHEDEIARANTAQQAVAEPEPQNDYAAYMAQRQEFFAEAAATVPVSAPEPEPVSGYAAYMAQRQEAPAPVSYGRVVPVSAPAPVSYGGAIVDGATITFNVPSEAWLHGRNGVVRNVCPETGRVYAWLDRAPTGETDPRHAPVFGVFDRSWVQ